MYSDYQFGIIKGSISSFDGVERGCLVRVFNPEQSRFSHFVISSVQDPHWLTFHEKKENVLLLPLNSWLSSYFFALHERNKI